MENQNYAEELACNWIRQNHPHHMEKPSAYYQRYRADNFRFPVAGNKFGAFARNTLQRTPVKGTNDSKHW